MRNPFNLRTSEQIVPDETFLRLFSPRVLEIVDDTSWDTVQIFQSAPGGGKTSLLRVFTPTALVALHRLKANKDYKELYEKMKSLEAISDEGPKLLGVMLSCAPNYATFEDLDIDPGQKERLLYSLLNVRIILAAIRGILTLKGLEYPKDLERLTIEVVPNRHFPEWLDVPVPCTGQKLANWARGLEDTICEVIDSFDPLPRTRLKGHDTLYSLQLLQPDAIKYQGKPIVERIVVMLDDVHKLTERQHEKFLDTVLNSRWPVSVWIAERLEALSPDKLLAHGAMSGRDYRAVSLEEYWSSSRRKTFANIVRNVADRRVELARANSVLPFETFLEDTIDEGEYRDKYDAACDAVSERLIKRVGGTPQFAEWLQVPVVSSASPQKNAISWRSLEILIERKIGDVQLALPIPFSAYELDRDAPPIQYAAELFLSREFRLPHYFGMSVVTDIASSNIDQFLDFAGALFELVISAGLLGREKYLSALVQEEVLTSVIQRRWREIPRRVPNGYDAQRLLQAIQDYANVVTYRPTAPYNPGVTGVALSPVNLRRLVGNQGRSVLPEHRYLSEVLSHCIANNLLEPRSITQGRKGQQWLVLYLNRWLCMRAQLPLQYGGWRPVGLTILCQWMEKGFDAVSGEGRLLI